MGADQDRDEGGLTMVNDAAAELQRKYNTSSRYAKPSSYYNQAGVNLAHAIGGATAPIENQGLGNLLQMLRTQGRMDPRLLARQQATNARWTQQQQDAARAGASRRGMGGGGLNQALQAAIGSAGANRAADFNYRDIADSYQRNQQNLGLMGQLVTQPGTDFAALGSHQYNADRTNKNQQNAGYAGAIASIIGAFA